ncbi:hypothetical protein MPSEU_000499700 [Mayamaea pseudoterrestris]|nr:hypothetical protein MPSEU_000499700 [Mayamaea pseudoterrestris]
MQTEPSVPVDGDLTAMEGNDERVVELPCSSDSDCFISVKDSPTRLAACETYKQHTTASAGRIKELGDLDRLEDGRDNDADDDRIRLQAAAEVDDAPSSLTEAFREVFQTSLAEKNTDESCTTRLEEQLNYWEHIAYISCFALFGTVVRIYTARFFGLDCEYKNTAMAVNDFLSPLTEHICITASGKTASTGGALFTDLPANMIGCFLAGLLTPSVDGHNLAWFRADHPLQRRKAFHAALRIGFCGSLTTFSSWNTQMVVMMDGTATVLGAQVPAAIFGYLLGIMCPLASYFFGRHVYDWWLLIHPQRDTVNESVEHGQLMLCATSDSDVESAATTSDARFTTSRQRWSTTMHAIGNKCYNYFTRFMAAMALTVTPFVVAALLVGAFAFAGHVENMPFYRKMWLSALLAPFGAVLRWWLVQFNDSKGYWKSLEFLPWGTLTANVLGCFVSILAEALNAKYFSMDASMHSSILSVIVLALEAGFSGSLSTVSTLISELATLKTVGRSYIYGTATVVMSLVIGLVVYCPMTHNM